MGAGLLTDCTGLSLAVRAGFKGLYTERWELFVGHFCILSIMRGNKRILSLSWLICVLVCLHWCLCVTKGENLMCTVRSGWLGVHAFEIEVCISYYDCILKHVVKLDNGTFAHHLWRWGVKKINDFQGWSRDWPIYTCSALPLALNFCWYLLLNKYIQGTSSNANISTLIVNLQQAILKVP